jgi:hypothetical protein
MSGLGAFVWPAVFDQTVEAGLYGPDGAEISVGGYVRNRIEKKSVRFNGDVIQISLSFGPFDDNATAAGWFIRRAGQDWREPFEGPSGPSPIPMAAGVQFDFVQTVGID